MQSRRGESMLEILTLLLVVYLATNRPGGVIIEY